MSDVYIFCLTGERYTENITAIIYSTYYKNERLHFPSIVPVGIFIVFNAEIYNKPGYGDVGIITKNSATIDGVSQFTIICVKF